MNSSYDIANEELEAAIGDQSATPSARRNVANVQHDPGLNPLGLILKEALRSDDIEEAVKRLELTRSGSDMSVAKYYHIETQAMIDMPFMYTAEDKRALANYDCDEADLRPEPTKPSESGQRWTPGVVEVCRLVNDQVNAVQDKSAPPAIMRIAGAPFMLFQDFQSGQIAALEWKLAFQTLIAIMKKKGVMPRQNGQIR